MDDLISCPFCGEKDFDLIGLKIHIYTGYCEKYDKINIQKPTYIPLPATEDE